MSHSVWLRLWIPYDESPHLHIQFISGTYSVFDHFTAHWTLQPLLNGCLYMDVHSLLHLCLDPTCLHVHQALWLYSASSMSFSCNDEGQCFRKLHIQLCTLACEAVKSQGCRRTGYQMCFLIICSAAYQQQIRELGWKSFSVARQPISQQRKTELLFDVLSYYLYFSHHCKTNFIPAVIPTGLCHFWDQK